MDEHLSYAHPREPLADASLGDAAGLADPLTPLIRRCWYVAALSTEVTREPMSRRLLGVDVVFYRTEAGAPVALRNRCPHRSFPLSRGRVIGDTLVCGYHGMQFDPSGRCVNLPAMAHAPDHARAHRFAVAERGPLVWIWMGEDADAADEAAIPDTAWLADAGWRSVGGSFHVGGDYVSMHENLLDQTHFPFLHPGAIGTPEYARSTMRVRRDGDAVIVERELLASPPPGVYAMPTGLAGEPVDRHSRAVFASPALHVAFARIVDPAPAPGARREFRFTITHLFTPETQHAIHYWWFNSRDFALADAAVDRHLHDASAAAYRQDVDALQWIAQTVRDDAWPQPELHFAPDKPGLLMRRALHERARTEAGVR